MSSESQKPDWMGLGTLEFEERGCPVCKSDSGRPLHTKVNAGYTMHFWLCNACNALYTRNPVSASSLSRLYGSADFFASGKPGEDNIDYYDFIGGEKYLRATAQGRLRQIQKFKPSGRLLEVASAAGFFVVEAKNAGYETEGIEISEPMAKYATERWGVPVRGASIELTDLPAETYDVIASWGVMTILRDPIAVIRKFHRALKPGGVWAFNTYYHDGLWHRLTGARWQHLGVQISQIFSRKLIQDVAAREGFELLSRRRDTPTTDILKVADQLALATGWKWLVPAAQKTGIAGAIIRIPLPDVLEYVWRKK